MADKSGIPQPAAPNEPVDVGVFLRLAPDVVLLRWMNYHLARTRFHHSPFVRRVYNFGSDLRDGLCLAALLSQIHPNVLSTKTMNVEDSANRCELVCRQLAMLRPEALTFITVQDIMTGDAMMLSCLVARLFTTHSTIISKSVSVKVMSQRVDQVESECVVGLSSCQAVHSICCH